MTPEQERIDAASHAPACPAVVDGFPCNRNAGHWGGHATGAETTAICALCGAERPMEAMTIELADGGMVWVCGGIDPVTGEDAITDCETRRGI